VTGSDVAYASLLITLGTLVLVGATALVVHLAGGSIAREWALLSVPALLSGPALALLDWRYAKAALVVSDRGSDLLKRVDALAAAKPGAPELTEQLTLVRPALVEALVEAHQLERSAPANLRSDALVVAAAKRHDQAEELVTELEALAADVLPAAAASAPGLGDALDSVRTARASVQAVRDVSASLGAAPLKPATTSPTRPSLTKPQESS
jgi:hypothetical protein